jgi:hypothetical protein
MEVYWLRFSDGLAPYGCEFYATMYNDDDALETARGWAKGRPFDTVISLARGAVVWKAETHG